MQKTALHVAAAIFAVVAIVHLIRLITGFQIVVDDIVVPLWISYFGAPVAALLAIWMVRAARGA